MTDRGRVTRLVAAGADLNELLPVVYDELRGLAAAYMRRERADHTLQPTALANEAYLRLVDDTKVTWRGRAQFLAIAARAMRQILIEHARAKGAAKRGGDRVRVTLSDTPVPAGGAAELDLLDLDAALRDLAEVDTRRARIVELRFFAGLTIPEAAEVLGLGETTVEDDWYFARAWLRRRMDEA